MTDRTCGLLRLLLLLASFLGVAAAGRRHGLRNSDWAPARPTGTPTTHGPLTNTYLPHHITEAPSLATLADLRRRQADSSICGYFGGLAEPLQCAPGWMCTNIGSHRDCCLGTEYCTDVVAFPTACVDWDHAACATSKPGTLCCSAESGFPFCRTYLYSTTATPSSTFSLLLCEYLQYSGLATIYPDPGTNPATWPASHTTTTAATTSSSTPGPPHDSSAPVGAIVGGVVGGLAVIGIVMLGIFYMFFHSRKRPESDDPGASVAFVKKSLEQTPTSSTASPACTSTSTAYTSPRSDSPHQPNLTPNDCRDQDDQRQPLIVPEMTPVEICENPRAGPSKDCTYTELPTNIYKSELPA